MNLNPFIVLPAQGKGQHPLPDPRYSQFIQSLASIQRKTGKALKIPDPDLVTQEALKGLQELAKIVNTGRYVQKAPSGHMEIKKAGIGILLETATNPNWIL